MRKKKSEGLTWDDQISVTRHAADYVVYWGPDGIYELPTLPEFLTQRLAVLDMLAPYEEIGAVGYKGHPSRDIAGVYRVFMTPDEMTALLDFIARSVEEKVEEKAHA